MSVMGLLKGRQTDTDHYRTIVPTTSTAMLNSLSEEAKPLRLAMQRAFSKRAAHGVQCAWCWKGVSNQGSALKNAALVTPPRAANQVPGHTSRTKVVFQIFSATKPICDSEIIFFSLALD